jgi:hypothetical protein
MDKKSLRAGGQFAKTVGSYDPEADWSTASRMLAINQSD